jgi:hypothetical protein
LNKYDIKNQGQSFGLFDSGSRDRRQPSTPERCTCCVPAAHIGSQENTAVLHLKAEIAHLLAQALIVDPARGFYWRKSLFFGYVEG